jgi:hypothetical protein
MSAPASSAISSYFLVKVPKFNKSDLIEASIEFLCAVSYIAYLALSVISIKP